jgi:hypothetical protein
MGRFACIAVFAVLLTGCMPIAHEPDRAEFGVSTARPDNGTTPPAATETAKLERKADQICVRGYTRTQLDIEAAEAKQQIIDMKMRCEHYDRLDFDYVHMGWSNLL